MVHRGVAVALIHRHFRLPGWPPRVISCLALLAPIYLLKASGGNGGNARVFDVQKGVLLAPEAELVLISGEVFNLLAVALEVVLIFELYFSLHTISFARQVSLRVEGHLLLDLNLLVGACGITSYRSELGSACLCLVLNL